MVSYSIVDMNRLRRIGIVLLTIAAFSLLAYAQIVRPNQHARNYDIQLGEASERLQSCFLKLADNEDLKLFGAPDISIRQKQQDVRTVQGNLRQCSRELQIFNLHAQKLQKLYLSGYTEEYRRALLTEQHAMNIAGQSSDVLEQYGQLSNFLQQYFASLLPFTTYFDELNRLPDVSVLSGRIPQLRQQAGDLHAQAQNVRTSKPFPGFETMIQPTATMLTKAGDGYDLLADGYATGNDRTIDLGFKMVESAVADYNGSVGQLSFDLLIKSYTVKQAAALPAKIEDLRRSVVE